ncbi:MULTISPECIES: hypothetical protein [unclassified Paenibacillus]|uniref:hypothetical protein n=2 Tax=Paenibacillus TaxID=44249 RepID=UPI00117FF334|nr:MULTISPECIES: hypothetical protein [unclassified Paenibacillus]
MIYGTAGCAMEYARRGAIHEWLQFFLRNDGKNVVLADGLLLEPRVYTGPVAVDITRFGIEEGAPSYLTELDEKARFFSIVETMTAYYSKWDMPPLIVNYADGKFAINDGRHRNVALRRMNITHAPVVFWTSSEADQRYISEYLSEEGMEDI